MRPDRKHSKQYVPFDTSDPASKAAWEALLVDGADLSPFEEGDMIYDAYSTTTLELRQTPTGNEWVGLGCTIRRVTTSAPVQANHLGKFAGPPPLWVTCSVDGEALFGVFMTDAAAGERVYVVMKGCYLVLQGDFPLPFVTAVTTDTLGRARQIMNFGEFYIGLNVDASTIGGVDYVLSTVNTQAALL